MNRVAFFWGLSHWLAGDILLSGLPSVHIFVLIFSFIKIVVIWVKAMLMTSFLLNYPFKDLISKYRCSLRAWGIHILGECKLACNNYLWCPAFMSGLWFLIMPESCWPSDPSNFLFLSFILFLALITYFMLSHYIFPCNPFLWSHHILEKCEKFWVPP